jgi:hypothetical protein
MGVCGTTAPTNRELLNLINSGKTPPVPKGVYFAAEYRAPGYAYTVKDWLNQPGHGRQGQNFSFISMKTGKDVKESEFGQESYGGGLSFSYLPWTSFAVNGSSDHEEGLDESLLNDNEVEIKLTYDEIRSVTVTPGAWCVVFSVKPPSRGYTYTDSRPGTLETPRTLTPSSGTTLPTTSRFSSPPAS